MLSRIKNVDLLLTSLEEEDVFKEVETLRLAFLDFIQKGEKVLKNYGKGI